jgi:hypothetical protein
MPCLEPLCPFIYARLYSPLIQRPSRRQSADSRRAEFRLALIWVDNRPDEWMNLVAKIPF